MILLVGFWQAYSAIDSMSDLKILRMRCLDRYGSVRVLRSVFPNLSINLMGISVTAAQAQPESFLRRHDHEFYRRLHILTFALN